VAVAKRGHPGCASGASASMCHLGPVFGPQIDLIEAFVPGAYYHNRGYEASAQGRYLTSFGWHTAGHLEAIGTVLTGGLGGVVAWPARTSAAPFVQIFRSHSALVRTLGRAGIGKQWHHIVEQTPGNVARFGAYAIHNTQNVVALEIGVHRQISAFYSSIQQEITGSSTLTVRQWLSTHSLNDQRVFGEQILRLFGAMP
jgi:hypothetical protein